MALESKDWREQLSKVLRDQFGFAGPPSPPLRVPVWLSDALGEEGLWDARQQSVGNLWEDYRKRLINGEYSVLRQLLQDFESDVESASKKREQEAEELASYELQVEALLWCCDRFGSNTTVGAASKTLFNGESSELERQTHPQRWRLEARTNALALIPDEDLVRERGAIGSIARVTPNANDEWDALLSLRSAMLQDQRRLMKVFNRLYDVAEYQASILRSVLWEYRQFGSIRPWADKALESLTGSTNAGRPEDFPSADTARWFHELKDLPEAKARGGQRWLTEQIDDRHEAKLGYRPGETTTRDQLRKLGLIPRGKREKQG